jgi:hypothetical protein
LYFVEHHYSCGKWKVPHFKFAPRLNAAYICSEQTPAASGLTRRQPPHHNPKPWTAIPVGRLQISNFA